MQSPCLIWNAEFLGQFSYFDRSRDQRTVPRLCQAATRPIIGKSETELRPNEPIDR